MKHLSDVFLGGFRWYRRMTGGKWELQDNLWFGSCWCQVDLWTSQDQRPFLTFILQRESYE